MKVAIVIAAMLAWTLAASADCHQDYQCWQDQAGRWHCGMNQHTNSAGCQ